MRIETGKLWERGSYGKRKPKEKCTEKDQKREFSRVRKRESGTEKTMK